MTHINSIWEVFKKSTVSLPWGQVHTLKFPRNPFYALGIVKIFFKKMKQKNWKKYFFKLNHFFEKSVFSKVVPILLISNPGT